MMSLTALQKLSCRMKKRGSSREEIQEVMDTPPTRSLNIMTELAILQATDPQGRLVLELHGQMKEMVDRKITDYLANFAEEQGMSLDEWDTPSLLISVAAHLRARNMDNTNNSHLANLAKQLRDKREEIADAESKLSALKEERDAIEKQAATTMALVGITSAKTEFGTLGLSSSQIASVEDWEAFMEYVIANHATHLIERRPAQAGCREIINSGEEIPGLSVFKKSKLTFRRN